mmetsp:Transcript_15290/g.27252  ORF Transcript_15290/g.27252 Transcript_15290/m.27252 type:complete len:273 (+) Transcript_15290:324-1142(+)
MTLADLYEDLAHSPDDRPARRDDAHSERRWLHATVLNLRAEEVVKRLADDGMQSSVSWWWRRRRNAEVHHWLQHNTQHQSTSLRGLCRRCMDVSHVLMRLPSRHEPDCDGMHAHQGMANRLRILPPDCTAQGTLHGFQYFRRSEHDACKAHILLAGRVACGMSSVVLYAGFALATLAFAALLASPHALVRVTSSTLHTGLAFLGWSPMNEQGGQQLYKCPRSHDRARAHGPEEHIVPIRGCRMALRELKPLPVAVQRPCSCGQEFWQKSACQ